MLAGLRRRGWGGRVVWAFAPVQDRRAAPAVTRALQDLAACPEVEVVIVARGGGSLADLFAFCDETLCRTVAHAARAGDRLGRPPHRPDADRRRRGRLLLDADARRRGGRAGRLRRGAGRAARPRGAAASARAGARSSSAPARSRGSRARRPTTSRATARGCTSSCASCARARAAASRPSSARSAATRIALERRAGATAHGLSRGAARARADAGALDRSAAAALARREQALERLRLALDAHDPQRTLERGYALVEDAAGEPVTTAAAAREHARLTLRMADGTARVRRDDDPAGGPPGGA